MRLKNGLLGLALIHTLFLGAALLDANEVAVIIGVVGTCAGILAYAAVEDEC